MPDPSSPEPPVPERPRWQSSASLALVATVIVTFGGGFLFYWFFLRG